MDISSEEDNTDVDDTIIVEMAPYIVEEDEDECDYDFEDDNEEVATVQTLHKYNSTPAAV